MLFHFYLDKIQTWQQDDLGSHEFKMMDNPPSPQSTYTLAHGGMLPRVTSPRVTILVQYCYMIKNAILSYIVYITVQ